MNWEKSIPECHESKIFGHVSTRSYPVTFCITSDKSIGVPIDLKTIWIQVPYASNAGEAIMKRLISKLKRCCKDKAYFEVLYKIRKLSSFCSTKDPIPFNLKSHVILFYQLQCPGCEARYIGKTERYLILRLDEHGITDHNSAMHYHLQNCEQFRHFVELHNLHNAINNKRCDVKLNHHIHNAILRNTSILATNSNFYQLCFLEFLYIKTVKPCLNTGIKATKELALFA